jgi:alpha-galactosidase
LVTKLDEGRWHLRLGWFYPKALGIKSGGSFFLFLTLIAFGFFTAVEGFANGDPTNRPALIVDSPSGNIHSAEGTDRIVALGSLDLRKVQQSDGWPQVNKSVGGRPLAISGQKFVNGLGTHARSVLWIDLQGGCRQFTTWVGIDDEVVTPIVLRELRSAFDKGYPEYQQINGRVVFQIYGDGKLLWKSKVMQTGMPAIKADVDLVGVRTLVLVASGMGDAVDYDHADWAEASFVVSGAMPKTIDPPTEEAVILTPAAPPEPHINGAKVFGVRPGSPFLFTIPATGTRPMKFAAPELPPGLELDSSSGRITGILNQKGEWNVVLCASNSLGAAQREFRILCGDTLALTPPMGWNTWNVFGREPDDTKARAAADAMVRSGLINHGWTYINIDDCWQIQHSSPNPLLGGAPRDVNGMVNANRRFPDMKSLCDYIHSKGLKAGIYSSPGLYTCQGYTGSFQHEEQDARRYAEWGFDYLKYDWCYTSHTARNLSLLEQRIPWLTMARALARNRRDIVFSLSETLEVWPWAGETGANCWRTTGDITDTWPSVDAIGFTQNGREVVAGPGHWNDCDMFVVGKLGGGRLHPTRLSPNEQYTHVSLWCLLASPLLIGCDLTQLDDFTLNLLSNDEVLEVNQDSLGRQAHRVAKDENVEVWAKEMEDGSQAVGLFNRGEFANAVTANWTDLGLRGKQKVRDLWSQRDVGEFTNSFTVLVARHGVKLIRLTAATK